VRRLAPLALAAVILLSGCTPFACTTIGYSSLLEVHTSTEVAAVSCPEGCDRYNTDLEQVEPGVWQLALGSSSASVTLVATDATGTEIARDVVEPVWVADDPGARCGSPLTSEPIELGAR
jgi:hypothetical protein